MNRSLLIAIGVVLVLALGLLLASRSGSGDSDDSQAADATRTDPGNERPAVPASRSRPDAPRSAGAASSTGLDTARPGSGGSREYMNRDGRLVRDHRTGGDDAPEFNAAVTERPRQHKVERRIVDGVRDGIYDSVHECMKSLDASGFGAKPRAQAEVMVSIREGQVTAEDTKVTFGDVPEEQGDALSQCIRDGVTGLAFAADGHEEIASHRVTIVFGLKP